MPENNNQYVTRQRTILLLCGACGAALATFLVFLTARGNDFVDLDDLGYIILNRHITSLDWQTVRWAFTSFHEYNWHPLTMLSLAVDYKFWGLNPFGYHLTNIVVHSGSVALACLVFARLLDIFWGERSTRFEVNVVLAGAVGSALLFGLHPLRVESVVWASERKDVLCIFFYLSAVWFYLRHAEFRKENSRGMSPWYWLVVLSAALSMLSKSAAVSLPFVLMLLDWHPLGRMTDRSRAWRVLREKLPLVLMAGATGVMTILAQQEQIRSAEGLSLVSRLLVASKALVVYLQEMVWPAGLAPHYPHPGNVTLSGSGAYLLSAIAVLAVAAAMIPLARSCRRSMPLLCAFYLITLLPMLGLIQVGGQWKADRYTYLPSLSVSLLWGGGIAWLFGRLWRQGRRSIAMTCLALAVCQVIAYSLLTLRQISVWQNTETMTSRIIDLMPEALDVYISRALFRKDQGEYSLALEDVDNALILAIRQDHRSRLKQLYQIREALPFKTGKLAEIVGELNRVIELKTPRPPAEYLFLRDQFQSQLAGASRLSLRPE